MRFIAIFASVRKDEGKKKRNFGSSYLGNGLIDFHQIWNVYSPSWWATLQQIWFQSDKVSPRYKCVKMTFSFFLSIYSRCGAPASWAARHTIVCLDDQFHHNAIQSVQDKLHLNGLKAFDKNRIESSNNIDNTRKYAVKVCIELTLEVAD